METKRRTEGAKTLDKIQDLVKTTLNPGVKTCDELAARIGKTYTLKAVTLSITTRAIGFGLAHLSFIAVSYHEIAVPSIYAQYRVFLAVLEAELKSLKCSYPIAARDTEMAYDYRVNSDLLHIAQTVTVTPEPMKTLRHLADVNTPDRYRRRFEDNNAIPGTIWNNHVLVNPDEIIPANHTMDDLRDDIALLGPYINKLQKHIPKMVDGTIDFKSSGKISSFVCNKMGNLRIPPRELGENLQDYYRRAYPVGNIREFHSYAKLTAAERLEGQINLLGELPRFENLVYPFYTMHVHRTAPHRTACVLSFIY
ncbi:unnamed protein product [Euphydryas editha]|uniref:Uncharacterized protein n=1 Tax=Euphydryas editha TaxID=104508 RepID=A0AAU9VC30_EUPED|nr:unnamed protein product [Euphydryas editha]